MSDDLLSTHQVCRLTGATYRQLDYWTRGGSIKPHQPAEGPGSARRWQRSQLPEVRRLVCAAWLRNAPLDEVAALLADAPPGLLARLAELAESNTQKATLP